MAAESTLLTANREELVKNIRFVEPFLDRLIQTNQLTTEECEEVRSGRTPQDRARALIDLVSTKGQEAFGNFRHVLKETNPELADILHRCTDHNEKIRLHCDDCVQLLCRTCNKEGHRGHRVSSIVADARVIRREVTAFVRDNRKMLKNFNASDANTSDANASDTNASDANVSDVEVRKSLLLDIELRKNALKAMFIAKIESEYEWCKDQLGLDERAASPAASISSVATSNTESELSGRPGARSPRSPGARSWRGVRSHPYSPVDQNNWGTQPRSPARMQHRVNRMPSSLKEMIHLYLPPSPTPPSVAFSPPISLSPSQTQSPSLDFLTPSVSPSLNLYLSPSTSPGLPFSLSARNTPTSRSPLSPISFSHDTNPRHKDFATPHPVSNSQRESFSQLSPPSHLTPDSPSLGFPTFPIVTPGPSFPPSFRRVNPSAGSLAWLQIADRVIQEARAIEKRDRDKE
ncbi:uncharacterized protein [Branchiostoma lanceolatum]|uniref:uncharacterized protein n=1 Tax=Branchiostoma lanceolatum TaxID=7740 RepID=UPI003451C516